MNVEEMLEGMLRRDEGERLKVYNDKTGKPIVSADLSGGHPTIGIGRALDVQGLTVVEASYLLLNDIQRVVAEVEVFPWYPALVDARKAVILSMVFQLGLNGFEDFTNLIAAVQYKNWTRAAAEMKSSKWFTQAEVRVTRLALQMETGVYQQ